MKRIELVLCVLLLALGVSSCSNMDELYKDYLTGSIYSGKVSDLTATAGNERVLLQCKPENLEKAEEFLSKL